MYLYALFLHIGKLLFSGLGSFRPLSAAGHAGGPPEHCCKRKFGPRPGRLRGARSGRSKSRHLVSNHVIGFRQARASRDNGKPTHKKRAVSFLGPDPPFFSCPCFRNGIDPKKRSMAPGCAHFPTVIPQVMVAMRHLLGGMLVFRRMCPKERDTPTG